MENQNTIKTALEPEGIDLNKLKIVVRSKWVWLLSIVVVVNIVAFLFLRYTKNIYESSSVLKLDVKKEASDFGIKTSIVDDPSLNLIAGEIEIIQSRLFLSRVLDSSALDVSYHSIGRVLNDELFSSHPFKVRYKIRNGELLDRQITFEETSPTEFVLKLANDNTPHQGTYNSWLKLDGMELLIEKNKRFIKGDEIGYFFVVNSQNALLDYLLRNLTAEPLNYNANTVRISFKDNNAFKANAVLNKIDTDYLQYSNEQKNLATKQKIEWISTELVNIEKKMENFETYFENFTLQNKSNNMDDDLKRTVSSINRIDSQRFELTQRIADINGLRESLASGNYFLSFSQRVSLPPSLTASLEHLENLFMEQEKLKLSYNEITFAYRAKQKEIETIRDKSIDQLTELKANFQRKLLEMDQRKLHLEGEFANLPDKSTQFAKNLRYYKLYEQFYLGLMQSKSEFEITQAGSIPDFKILSPATMPKAPLSPNKLMVAGIGFVASVMLMLFYLGTVYLLNDKITSITEVERLHYVPILGVVPASRYIDKVSLHIIEHPRSMVSEAIRTLRTNLDFFNANSSTKVITISSTVSGEGKSFIAQNLGGIMALSDKKVIMLDLDMRKPKTFTPGGTADRTKGISTILIGKNGWEECVMKTELENFDYVPSGPHPPNPSELLMNGSFDGLLEGLKKQYDYIILDTPPVGLVTDGIMAMKRSDVSIYIFRANYSKKEFLFNLQRIISINKFSNITTLLNALPNTGEHSYGYGYYEEPGDKKHWTKKIFKA